MFTIFLIQDILPSDGLDATRGSSLFGTTSPLPQNTAGNAKAAKPSAASPRKTAADDSDSEATETESEWEKERASKKAQKEEEQQKVSSSLLFLTSKAVVSYAHHAFFKSISSS